MFVQRFANNFKSSVILVFYISLIEVNTRHKRVAPSETLAERKSAQPSHRGRDGETI